jgi:hypothetical protein
VPALVEVPALLLAEAGDAGPLLPQPAASAARAPAAAQSATRLIAVLIVVLPYRRFRCDCAWLGDYA